MQSFIISAFILTLSLGSIVRCASRHINNNNNSHNDSKDDDNPKELILVSDPKNYEIQPVATSEKLYFVNEYDLNTIKGLQNHGNTCFMNASLQLLLHLPEFTKDFPLTSLEDLGKISPVVSAFRQLAIRYHSKQVTSPLYAKYFTDIARKEFKFHGYSQEDSQEFFSYLLDKLGETDASINNAFKFNLYNHQYVDKNDIHGIILDAREISFLLPVRFPSEPKPNSKAISLSSLIQYTYSKQRYKSEKDYYKPATGTVYTFNNMEPKLLDTTKYIMIQLSRFVSNTNKSFEQSKINKEVSIPLEYQLDGKNLDLLGIVHHGGDVGGGHYWSDMKLENGTWHNFNDSSVTTITPASPIVSNTAYLLLYKVK